MNHMDGDRGLIREGLAPRRKSGDRVLSASPTEPASAVSSLRVTPDWRTCVEVLRLWLPPIITAAILFLFVFVIPAIFGGL